MTVSTEVDHNDYTGNGVTTSFPYTFRIFKKSDLTVQVADLNENITVLTLDTDYSVTGAGSYSGGSVVLMSPLASGWKISVSRNLPVTQETDLRNQGKFFAEVHEDAFDKLTMLIQQCFSFLRLALRKPSFIANYYDALNNRIRNLRDPSQAQDAATKNYVDVQIVDNTNAWKAGDAVLDQKIDANFRRTIRVPEPSVGMLPSILARKNKLIACDSNGDPIAVLPESGSASEVLIELASNEIPGSSLIGLKYHGTIADALDDIYVDALGDFSDMQDGCAEAITARIQEITGMTDSVYVFGHSKYITVHFGYGTYKLKNMVCFSGVFFKGKPGYGTQIIPHEDGDFAFVTSGTLPFELNGVRVWKRLMYFGFEDLIIGEYWEDTGKVPAGKGGISLKFTSYGYMRNVHFRRIKACAFDASELFDFKADNVTAMYCGNVDTKGVVTHCLNLDRSGTHDATNACEFDRLHLEANYTGMRLRACRHMNFIAPKFERDDTPHLLEGSQGVIFTSPNMTWNRSDAPQFDIYPLTGTETSDSHGVKFVAPDMRSSGGIGWYFRSNGAAGMVELVSPTARGITKIITGTNWKIIGGDVYDSGPQLLQLGSNSTIDGLTCRAMKPTVAGDGTDDTIIVTGVNCAIRNTYLASQAGSSSDGGAMINTTATTDTIITGNTFGGYRQYGIRGAVNQKVRDNKTDISNNHIGSLTNQTRTNSTLVNKNTTGFGLGSVDGEITGLTLASGATMSYDKVAGASLFWLRFIVNGVTGSALVFVDASNPGLTVIANTNPSLIASSAGSAGDGLIHITKPLSGGTITISNYTSSPATLVPLVVSGHG